jgi:predicted transcriptional regulator
MTAAKDPHAPIVELQPETHRRLQRLAANQHRPMGDVVTDLLERYEKDAFWDEVSQSINRLRADPEAWQDYQEEIALLEGGSLDGLEDDPYFTPEEEEKIRAESARSKGR